MFIIYYVYVKEKEMQFSNTCNVIQNYYPGEKNETKQIEDLNKLSIEAYKSSNKLRVFETAYGFIEELVLYNDYLFCFICSDSYKLLFNCLPAKDLFIYNSFPNLNKYQLEKIHRISENDIIGNIKITLYNGSTLSYRVICSYEAFLSYCNENNKNSLEENSTKLIFDAFLQNLIASKITTSNINSNYGLTTSSLNSPHVFNYLYFDSLMVITNYKKTL